MNQVNKILALISVVLFGLVLVLEDPLGKDSYEISRSSASALFPGFRMDQAEKIEIKNSSSGKAEEAILKKDSSGKWVVDNQFGYLAQEGAVQNLLMMIGMLKTNLLVDENPADLDKPYNLGEKGIEVKISDASGKLIAGFVQGKLEGEWKDPDYQRRMRKMPSFIRKLDGKAVYEVPQFVPLNPSAKYWLDSQLSRFDATKAEEIHLEGEAVGGVEIVLKREGQEWKMLKPEEAPAKKEVVDAMARSLSAAYFKELVGPLDDPAKYELATPQLKITIRLESAEQYSLLVGKQQEDKSYYVSKGEREKFVFSVHPYTVEALKKTVADLKFVPPPPEEPKEVPK